MIKRTLLSIACLLAISPICEAGMFDVFISGGAAWSRLKNNGAVQINEVVVNDYVTDRVWRSNGILGAGFAYNYGNFWDRFCLDASFGAAAYFLNYDEVRGTEFPFVTGGDFDTLNYSFRAKSTALMFESRLAYKIGWRFEPYFILGIGPSWNRLYTYEEVPTDPNGSAAPAPFTFGNRWHTSFAYEAGLGFKAIIGKDCCHCIDYYASVDYRYMNFGHGELGTSPVQTTSDLLETPNMYAHTLMFTLGASF